MCCSKRVDQGPEHDSNHMLESEIFEMLFTLTDFVKFKELFMDYKEVCLWDWKMSQRNNEYVQMFFL